MILLWPFEGKKTLKTFMVHPSHGFKPQKKAEAQKAPEASPGRNVRPSVGLVVRTRGVHFVVRTRVVHSLLAHGMCTLSYLHGVCTLLFVHGVCIFFVRTQCVHFFVHTQGGGGYLSEPQIHIT